MADFAVVLGSNTHWAPYYFRYEKMLLSKNIKFDLIIWNREGINEKVRANIISFNTRDKSNNKNPMKVFKFIMYSNFVLSVIKKNKYKKIIFLGTHGCAPVFCARFLRKEYKNKYWIDIRDYQYEWFKPFYMLEKMAIKSSFATAISSKGYEQFLPKHRYLYVHNIDPNMDAVITCFDPIHDKCIRISFIGNVRYYEECFKLIDIFANDSRFCLQFFGSGSDSLQRYCEGKGISNAKFYGRFSNEKTVEFYNQTDIINNVYGNENIGLMTALSNKLYYAMALRLPILVCSNTYIDEFCRRYGFGICIEYDSKFPDRLYKWYKQYQLNFNTNEYKMAWDAVNSDEKSFIENFFDFLA